MLAIAGIVALAALMLIPHIYVDLELGGPGQVLWNDQQCFIFVQTNNSGWRLTPSRYLISGLLGALGARTDFTDTDAIVEVFHIHDGRVDEHTVRHFQLATTTFPYQGKLYMMYYATGSQSSGVADEAKNYVWDGQTFVPVDKGEANRIRGTFQYQEEILSKEGWTSKSFNSSFSGWSVEIGQPNGKYLLEIQHPSQSATTITLRRPATEQELIKYGDGKPRLVSKGKYYSIFSPQS